MKLTHTQRFLHIPKKEKERSVSGGSSQKRKPKTEGYHHKSKEPAKTSIDLKTKQNNHVQ